jgi:hypothetical protein
MQLDAQRVPTIHENEEDLTVFSGAKNMVATWQYFNVGGVVIS